MLNPAAIRQANVPIIETMMEREGISVLFEILQEEIDYKNHQDDGDNQGFYHIVDRGKKEVVRTHHLDKFQSGRKVFCHFVDFGGNGSVRFRGVTARYLENQERYTRFPVHFAMIGV